MSDRLVLEIYERVAALESKVAYLEGLIEKTNKDSAPAEKPVKDIRGRYRYLADYLHNSGKDIIDLTFSEIEEILQSKLPVSCRKHRALWANTESHSIALAWMSVGYKTTSVDMQAEKIRFEKR